MWQESVQGVGYTRIKVENFKRLTLFEFYFNRLRDFDMDGIIRPVGSMK